ncbi:Dps family protein [Bradyrhizobium liaoningense]|uniref:Dps family protein n=1 Tax=Bradyrhizobium liaoningense TaxID=43992 RepID=UPI001BAC2988|nr:DNA starvation/stationary phase protection protein [Bradyrhizobium liaoningense]MBR0907830.1 DNA starvation/stationary phase protection protein [Bradyrhizobium liaoningense]
MGTAVEARTTTGIARVGESIPLEVVVEISETLTDVLADMFVLYVKTRNFHWHMSGPHFRDYHLLLDEQAKQVFATVDALAERCRNIGGQTIRSIGEIVRRQRLKDCEVDLSPEEMLGALRTDNLKIREFLMAAHAVCDQHQDVATASALENWIDEAERRIWFLIEKTRC